ncbi:MAG: radical SAM protein, partial [Candidatus Hodarchaeales archaeon]
MTKTREDVFQRKALLQRPIGSSKVQCGTCWHRCEIPEGKHGFCRTRVNVDGMIFTLNYGMVSTLIFTLNYGMVSTFSINPIEKKPLFHYYPGSHASTIGSVSCNFRCPWCQNWKISKSYPSEVHVSRYLSPEQLIKKTEEDTSVTGISVSFNEPTLSLEYVLDVFRSCKSDTYKMLVTNGYMTGEALELLIDAGMT